MTMSHDQPHDQFTERVLGQIERERVSPRPRWEFLLKEYAFWTFGALAVALGALAFSATLFEITVVDWRFSGATHPNSFSFLLAAIPFLWIGALAIFVFVGYRNIRSTRHGYRYPLAVLTLGAILTSVALGTGLYAAGLGRAVDDALGDHPPFYRPIVAEERSWWLAPERGLLIGHIATSVPDVSSFVLQDVSGRSWDVDGSDLRDPDIAVMTRGGAVRIIGLPVPPLPSESAQFIFHACFVFPWDTHGSPFAGAVPPPTFSFRIASTSEKDALVPRSGACRGIRLYQQLHSMERR